MNKLLLFICLYLELVNQIVTQEDNYAGGFCNLPDGRLGECKNIKNCSYAIDLVRKQERPKLCKFDEKDPVVCCLPTALEPKQQVEQTILRNSNCTLSDGSPGECKSIRNCSYAINLLRENKKPNLCWFDAKDPVVCCSQTPPKIENKMGSIILKNKDDYCTLSDGRIGECKNIRNCSYAINLLRNRKRPKICGFYGKDPIVCCLPSLIKLKTKKLRQTGEISLIKCIEYHRVIPTTSALPDHGDGRYDYYLARATFPGQFKHMAAVGFDYEEKIRWACGGTLISEKFVLTAAHCLNSVILGLAKYVRLGGHNLASEKDIEGHQDVLIKRRIRHPKYTPPSVYHDIALLELERFIPRSRYIDMACLNIEKDFKSNSLIGTGWGKIEYHGPSSQTLLFAFLQKIPQDECKQVYEKKNSSRLPNGIVDDIIICAGGQSDACEGDSGGPIGFWNTSGEYEFIVVGVTSSGRPCGIGKMAGIFTRVTHYIDWIENIVWPDE